MRRLNSEQFAKLSDIASDIGAIAFASVAIPAFTEKPNYLGASVGLVTAIFFWYWSLKIIKVTKEN